MPRYVSASKAARAAVLLAALAAAWPAAAAKVSEQKRAAVLQAVVDCRALTDRDKRLDCFDAAAAKLDEAEAAGQVVVVDRDQARQVRREVFGLALPSLDIFEGAARGPASAANQDDIDRVTDTVKRAWMTGDGKWVVELDGGAVWRQIDSEVLGRDPRPGSKVEIRRASLGSFFLKIDGQPGVKAHRDR
ncbi:MAG: hypothetical protein WDM92_09305 [Caulobacteraceae bacterium]